jgi:hypothetical protein
MASARICVLQPDGVLIVMTFVVADNQYAAFAVMIRLIPPTQTVGCIAKATGREANLCTRDKS